MTEWSFRNHYQLRIIEKPDEMIAVEDFQRILWFSSDTDIVPKDLLVAATHNGGLLIGAYEITTPVGESSHEIDMPTYTGANLVGIVFGFPGIYWTPDGPHIKHCSHMMGVHPEHRSQGLGFALKRAQWQIVRQQNIDLITWTFDPLLSRNAYLNIARLGAVCRTYIRDAYGVMTDGLNKGLPSDRFQVEWWLNTPRVTRRLGDQPRPRLDMAHYLAADTPIVNPTFLGENNLPHPSDQNLDKILEPVINVDRLLFLLEIPADLMSLKAQNPELALEWRLHTRELFETFFEHGYLVTDFLHMPGDYARSFYVFTFGESTL